MELHGWQKQNKRTAIYFNFVEEKFAFLFCTDIASRGMDFPQIDWVLQFDCPEDIETYIHRVGRTARYKSKGNGLLFLSNSEAEFVKKLEQKKIELKLLKSNPKKCLTIKNALSRLNAENQDLKYLA